MENTIATALDVYASNDSPTWTEGSITWNNQPGLGAKQSALPTVLQGTSMIWYEVDVTAYVKARKAAGKPDANLVLHSVNNGGTNLNFNSREATINQSQLVITP